MNYYDKIKNIIEKNNGYITAKEATDNHIPRLYLSKMVDINELIRFSRGHYIKNNIFEDEFYKLIKKSKNAVYSHNTALYLHGLSGRTPLIYDITVPSGYNGTLQKDVNVRLNYIKRDNLKLGLINITSPFGKEIPVYDIERTICDIIKNKNKMDKEILSKALKNYTISKNKDLLKLIKYAEILRIKKKIMEYLEILL